MLRSGFVLGSIFVALTLAGCGSQTVDTDSSAPLASSESTVVVGEATADQIKPENSIETADSADANESSSANPATQKGEPQTVAANDPASESMESESAKPPVEDKPEFPDATKLPSDLLDEKALTPLNPAGTVLLDVRNRRVFAKTKVCFTDGVLEMLLCLSQTKEHESILVFDGKAQTIHAGLLALGLKEGKPSSYELDRDVYIPASGTKLDIFLHWMDRDGKLHREPAQSWCRNSRFRYYEEPFETLPADLRLDPDGKLRYDDMNKVLFWYGPMSEAQRDAALKLSTDEKFQKAIRRFHEETQPKQLAADFIFVGSGFVNDPEYGEQYLAEGGYVICVANFAAAMIDLSIESSASGNENLTYEAWTERIPPRGSEVLVEIVPRPVEKEAPAEAAVEESK
jgi:hypothetical protein